MSNYRWLFLAPLAALLVACSSTYRSAPIVDRTDGVKPASMFAGKPGYYIVKRGDTLSQIARLHKQRPSDIAAWNNLSNPNDIRVDQVIRVAPPGMYAAEEARADSVQVQPVEVKPLVATTPTDAATAASHKTTPKGDKQPYSDSTLAALQKPQGAEAVVGPPAAQPKEAVKPAAAVISVNGDDNVQWQWPAQGKIIGTFVEGKSRGIDIAGKAGQRVNAAAAGRVIYAGAFRGYGNLVIVKHTENLLSAYAHNRTILVKQGDDVALGQQIAEMGNTDSDVVKLHFEIRRQGGKPVDPARFLPAR